MSDNKPNRILEIIGRVTANITLILGLSLLLALFEHITRDYTRATIASVAGFLMRDKPIWKLLVGMIPALLVGALLGIAMVLRPAF